MGFALHLTDSDPIACARLGAALRHDGAAGREPAAAVLIGGSDDERAAHQAGLATFDRLHPPRARAQLARNGLRMYCASRGWPRAIVCWSESAWRLAAAACPATPRVVVLDKPPRSRRRRDGLVAAAGVFADDAVQDAWTGGSEADAHASVTEQTVIAPPSSTPSDVDRSNERARWTTNPDAIVVGLVGSPLGAGDARLLGFAIGALALAGRSVVGVAPPGAAGLIRAMRAADRSGRWRVLSDDLAPVGRIESLDVALWLPDSPGARRHEHPFGLRRALAAGAPAVAAATPQTRALSSDGALLRLTGADRVSVTSALLDAAAVARPPRPADSDGGSDWRRWLDALSEAMNVAAGAPVG